MSRFWVLTSVLALAALSPLLVGCDLDTDDVGTSPKITTGKATTASTSEGVLAQWETKTDPVEGGVHYRDARRLEERRLSQAQRRRDDQYRDVHKPRRPDGALYGRSQATQVCRALGSDAVYGSKYAGAPLHARPLLSPGLCPVALWRTPRLSHHGCGARPRDRASGNRVRTACRCPQCPHHRRRAQL